MVKISDKFRENAQNCLQLAENAKNDQTTIRYRRMAQSWSALATEQDWLDGYLTQDDAQTERASELAGLAIDALSDKDASTSDVKARKSHLMDGPSEFLNSRIDGV